MLIILTSFPSKVRVSVLASFIHVNIWSVRASLVAQTVKNLPAMQKTWVQSLGGEDPWRRAWQPTPVFVPGESPWTEEPGRHPRSRKESHIWSFLLVHQLTVTAWNRRSQRRGGRLKRTDMFKASQKLRRFLTWEP